MRVHFLGTSGFHPTEHRHTAGILIPELGIAFDAGTSAFRIPPLLQSTELTIFISHAHLDHICGLTYLLVPLLQQTLHRCVVYAQPLTLTTIEQHLFCPDIFPIRPRIELLPLPDSVSLPGGDIRWWPLHHPGGATGYRLDRPDGRSLAYMSDTNANVDSLDFLRGVDVLIHECTFPDHLAQWCEPTGHSHTSQVARLARDAGVGRLFLTHIDPLQAGPDPLGLDAARVWFPATETAVDLQTIEW